MRNGAHFVALDFVSADKANGDLRTMADQVRRESSGYSAMQLLRRATPIESMSPVNRRAHIWQLLR